MKLIDAFGHQSRKLNIADEMKSIYGLHTETKEYRYITVHEKKKIPVYFNNIT